MSWSAPEDWSRWDPETLLQCPYDQGHLIRAKRYQHHLLKCRKNYPDRDFVNCPFNAKHVMLRSKVRHHVSRCPDRSAIEQYSYKGSEKDDEGFYFKGNTSVPSYHRTEDLQRGLESWDGANEEEQAQRNHEHESVHNQHSESELRDTSSLSPEEQKRFKRNLKREAALRGMNNSVDDASTWKAPSSNAANLGQANSANSNHPIFNHCTQQLQTTSRTSFHEPHNLTINAEKTEHSGAESKNRIFRYCMEKMQQNPYCDEASSSVSLASNREHESSPVSVSENSVSWYEDSVASSVGVKSPPRHSSVEIRRETWCTDNAGNRSELAAVSNICGSPTSSTCVGNKTSPQLAGVGRARLHAEARKSNFGGISYSHPGASGADARKTPPVGRGRGMLNYMFLSES